ncbi:NUDIX hydrolase domain-like protein [Myxozyma melibiosi]|uniref:NUDIX hydrolase domain-like protein n=1 Tax=Myxozyma melibiosi TaxID=54550 RepID=A0ABR1F9G0_9ASCO
MQSTARQMIARQGREKQRYSATGARMVAGVVALSPDKRKILVISSSKGNRSKAVIPKGGYETDEASAQAAALREAWEEAGVEGRITRELGVIEDMRPAAVFSQMKNPSLGTGDWERGAGVHPKAEYHMFEMEVEMEAEVWPESSTRMRRWVTYREILKMMSSRPELLEAVKRSSVIKEE